MLTIMFVLKNPVNQHTRSICFIQNIYISLDLLELKKLFIVIKNELFYHQYSNKNQISTVKQVFNILASMVHNTIIQSMWHIKWYVTICTLYTIVVVVVAIRSIYNQRYSCEA